LRCQYFFTSPLIESYVGRHISNPLMHTNPYNSHESVHNNRPKHWISFNIAIALLGYCYRYTYRDMYLMYSIWLTRKSEVVSALLHYCFVVCYCILQKIQFLSWRFHFWLTISCFNHFQSPNILGDSPKWSTLFSFR